MAWSFMLIADSTAVWGKNQKSLVIITCFDTSNTIESLIEANLTQSNQGSSGELGSAMDRAAF